MRIHAGAKRANYLLDIGICGFAAKLFLLCSYILRAPRRAQDVPIQKMIFLGNALLNRYWKILKDPKLKGSKPYPYAITIFAQYPFDARMGTTHRQLRAGQLRLWLFAQLWHHVAD